MAESSFWSLNSLVVEPIYIACREGLRQLVERLLQSRLKEFSLPALRAGTAGAAGVVIFAVALAALMALLAELALVGQCGRSCFASRSGFRRPGQQHRARRRLSRRRRTCLGLRRCDHASTS